MDKSVRYVEWSDKFNIGVKEIDNQHKHFISIMNKLFEAMQSDDKDAVPKIIDELVAYADVHFETEEKYFKKFNYPDTAEHLADHYKIKREVINFLGKKYDDSFKLGYDLLDILEDWLFKHISTMDAKFSNFFHERSLH